MHRARHIVSIALAATIVGTAGLVWSHSALAGVLIGDSSIESAGDSNTGGLAEAFTYTASASGSVTALNAYVDTSSAATTLVVGLYTDSAAHPATLLAQGSLANPVAGTWNTVSVAATPVTSGATYWLALLGVGGTLAFRDTCCSGAPSENSAQANLSSLPAQWSAGARWADGPASVYASSTAPPPPPPTPTPTPTPPPTQVGQWSSVMNWPLVAIHSIVTRTGNVLAMDGWQTPNASEVFNPTTQTFTQVNNGLGDDLFCSGHVTMADGRIAVVGGDGQPGNIGSQKVAIFDPAANSWTAAAPLNTPRWYPTVTELGDGRLVAISGQINVGSWADTPEVYTPSTNTWTNLSNVDTSQVHEEEYPLSYLAPSGKIFTIAPSVGQSFLLDPNAQTWTATGGAALDNGSAAEYLPGKILYSGGGTPLTSDNPAQTSAETIDLNATTPTWQATGSMTSPRYTQTLTVLPDGNVLAIGGSTVMDDIYPNTDVLASEEWNPATGHWTALASMTVERMYHSTAVLLPDGRVLSAGSGHDNDTTGPGEYNAQFYSPPYLFNGARPAISSAPSSLTYGSTVTVNTPDAASIKSVALVSLGADTHTLDMNQHFVPLSFTTGSGSLNVTVPSSPSVAPPNYYMLFIVNSNGVPSVAPILQLGATTPPAVAVTAPAAGATVSGAAVTLSATASDPTGIAGVQMMVDGSPVGPRLTAAPYTVTWNSTAVSNGTHTVTAQATDTAGVVGTSGPVSVTVSNTAPAGPSVDSKISVEGRGTVTTAGLTTAHAGDVLVAFASSDGPASGQQLTVSGGGLTWSLVKRANTKGGSAEIWTATAASALSGAAFTSKESSSNYDQSLNVIAFTGAKGIGATSSAAAASGAPSVALTTTAASSWVFGVGNDWDNAVARTTAAGQVLQYQWLDTGTGDTYWVQSTTAPTPAAGTALTIADTAPTGDRWNLAAVEVLAH